MGEAFLFQQLGDPELVRRIRPGMEQGDRGTAETSVVAGRADPGAQLGFIEPLDLAARGIEPAATGEHRGRKRPMNGLIELEKPFAPLVADLQQIAEAPRDDEQRRRPLALQQSVRPAGGGDTEVDRRQRFARRRARQQPRDGDRGLVAAAQFDDLARRELRRPALEPQPAGSLAACGNPRPAASPSDQGADRRGQLRIRDPLVSLARDQAAAQGAVGQNLGASLDAVRPDRPGVGEGAAGIHADAPLHGRSGMRNAKAWKHGFPLLGLLAACCRFPTANLLARRVPWQKKTPIALRRSPSFLPSPAGWRMESGSRLHAVHGATHRGQPRIAASFFIKASTFSGCSLARFFVSPGSFDRS